MEMIQKKGRSMRALAIAGSWPLLLALCCALLVAQSGPAGSFDKIKSLSGEWTGKMTDNKPATSSFRVTAGGSAVLQMLGEGTEYEMPTIYHMDGDRMMATHYCAAQNQPRMVLQPNPGSPNTLRFDFLDATNLRSPDDGHMRRIVITFIDQDHFRQEWTYREKGKESTDTFEFTRKR